MVYVGGLQGVGTSDKGRLYKELTKAAHGLRPRDLLVELLRIFCEVLGITRILAISDAARHHKSAYSRYFVGEDPVKSSYDEVWIDRGGVLRPDGFFDVSIVARRRSREDTPANKRTMYAARYRMLDNIATALRAALNGAAQRTEHPNLGVPRRPDATKSRGDDSRDAPGVRGA